MILLTRCWDLTWRCLNSVPDATCTKVSLSVSTNSLCCLKATIKYSVGQKSKPDNFCNNFVYCQPIFIIFGTYIHYKKFATGGCIVSPPNVVCVTSKIIAKISRLTFLAHPVCLVCSPTVIHKRTPYYYCNNFVYSQPFFTILSHIYYTKFATRR